MESTTPLDFKTTSPAAPTHCTPANCRFPIRSVTCPRPRQQVVSIRRSEAVPRQRNGSLKLNDPSGFNKILTDPVTHVQTMQLYPGIYDSISITGGNVIFYPGIYVLASQKSNQATLSINGGNVTANGVMFYNTGSNYNPATGAPDTNDKTTPPPITDGALLGSVSINGVVPMLPIDTNISSYNYGGYQSGAPGAIGGFQRHAFLSAPQQQSDHHGHWQRRNWHSQRNALRQVRSGKLYRPGKS